MKSNHRWVTSVASFLHPQKLVKYAVFVLLLLIAYNLISGWRTFNFAPQLMIYTSDTSPSLAVAPRTFHVNTGMKFKIFSATPHKKEQVQAFLQCLRSQDANFIDLATSDAVFALSAAMDHRQTVLVPRNSSTGEQIWSVLVANNVTKSIHVVKMTEPAHKAIGKLTNIIPFKRAVVRLHLEDFREQLLINAAPLFAALDIVVVLTPWPKQFPDAHSSLLINFLTSRAYKPHSQLPADTPLAGDTSGWPAVIFWKKASLQRVPKTPHIQRFGKHQRVQLYVEDPVPDAFTRHTYRTPNGPAIIYIYGPADLISRSILQSGTWEAPMNTAFATVLREDPQLQVLDLGTNLGVYALIAAKLGRRSVAVDANVNNVKRLRKSVLENGFQQLIKILWNAIDCKYTSLRMVIPDSNIGGSWVVNPDDSRAKKGTDIPTILIDDILEVIDFKRAVLKYDIEGMEYAGLHNASKLFEKLDIPYVFMEWGVIKRDYKAKGGRKIPDFIINFFQSRGYRAFRGIHDTGKLAADFNAWPWDIVWHKSMVRSEPRTTLKKAN